MILEFICSNHKSIKEAVTFSMIAGSDNSRSEYLYDFLNLKVLRSAVIYGANGSGKSNFISALVFMHDLVCHSISYPPGYKVSQALHKLSSAETPSEYSMQFVKNGIRYAYGFSIVQNIINEEYLFFFPNGKKVKIFERNGLEISPGNKYKGAFGLSKDALKENRLFLSCAANYSNLNEIEEAYKFFSSDLVIYNPKENNWTELSIQMMQKDRELKKLFVSFLQSLGTGAKDINVKQNIKIEIFPQQEQLSDFIKGFINPKESTQIEAKIIYDQFEVDLMEESAGVRRMFQMLCPIIDILRNDKVLICDELETNLHESVVYQIVQLFQAQYEDHSAQLIFSTHDTSLLDTDLFRKDQIWFTQLNEYRATELYSLVEIKDICKSEKKGQQYMNGKYGAIPMLNTAIFGKSRSNN